MFSRPFMLQFLNHDRDETMRLLRAARAENAALTVSDTCVGAPGCSKTVDRPQFEIQCFVCLQRQHVECALWQPALQRYPPGLYLCHRCCRTKRPYTTQAMELVNDCPVHSLEGDFVRARVEDMHIQLFRAMALENDETLENE